jgi:hypothetical protein
VSLKADGVWRVCDIEGEKRVKKEYNLFKKMRERIKEGERERTKGDCCSSSRAHNAHSLLRGTEEVMKPYHAHLLLLLL